MVTILTLFHLTIILTKTDYDDTADLTFDNLTVTDSSVNQLLYGVCPMA